LTRISRIFTNYWGGANAKENAGNGGVYDRFLPQKVSGIRLCFAAKTIEYLGVKAPPLYHQDAERATGIVVQLLSGSRERKFDEM
jgi:hypothetical protein